MPGISDTVLESLPSRATVTVTASPRQGNEATISTAVSLAMQGMYVVPHLSARMIQDEAALKTTLDTLTAAGIKELFVVGGDVAEPVGEYTSALDVLPTITQSGHGLRIGIAGYPEPHPLIDGDVALQALLDKRPYASYVVSQMCFDARALLTWVRRLRERGVDLPVLVGVPGPATAGKLLASPVPWRPNQLLRDLAPGFTDPDYGLQGLHVYTFNDVVAAGHWWQEAARGDQEAAHTLDQ